MLKNNNITMIFLSVFLLVNTCGGSSYARREKNHLIVWHPKLWKEMNKTGPESFHFHHFSLLKTSSSVFHKKMGGKCKIQAK